MDARYSKASYSVYNPGDFFDIRKQMDRIDTCYFAHSSRIDVKEETRIKATSDEASLWVKENETPGGIVASFTMMELALTLLKLHRPILFQISSILQSR